MLGLLVPVALYFWLISSDGVDMLRADQWFDIKLIHSSFAGSLQFNMLWGQHGENRVLFQNLITLLLAHLTHYNVLVEEYLSAVLLLTAGTFLVLTHHRRSPRTPWIAYCPAALVLFTVAQSGGTLYGYALGWYLIMAAFAAALFFLDRPVLTRIAFCAAIAAGVVASFSSLQGLFVWPVGLALLLQRARGRPVVIGWLVAGVATAIIYFYNWDAQQGSLAYAVHHPLDALQFFFFAIGDIINTPLTNSPNGSQYLVLIFGVAVVAVGVWSIISYGLRVDISSARPVGVALIWFGLLFAIGATGSRAPLGISNASFSLYVAFDLLVLLGSYLVVIDRSREAITHHDSRVAAIHWLPGTAVGLLVGLQILFGTINGLSNASAAYDSDITGAVVAANIQHAPDSIVESQLGGGYESAGFIRQMTDYARIYHLSLFSTAAIDSYAKEGLPGSRTPPVTTLRSPLEGASLRGVAYLDGLTSDVYATGVEFVVRHQDGAQSVVSRGGLTIIGWLGSWNTRGVSNGVYWVRSVAFAQGGLRGASPWVEVRVAN